MDLRRNAFPRDQLEFQTAPEGCKSSKDNEIKIRWVLWSTPRMILEFLKILTVNSTVSFQSGMFLKVETSLLVYRAVRAVKHVGLFNNDLSCSVGGKGGVRVCCLKRATQNLFVSVETSCHKVPQERGINSQVSPGIHSSKLIEHTHFSNVNTYFKFKKLRWYPVFLLFL